MYIYANQVFMYKSANQVIVYCPCPERLVYKSFANATRYDMYEHEDFLINMIF